MPLFEYVCRDCHREFEAFVTADRAPACPECHGANLGKLLSRPGMVGASAQRSGPAPEFGGCGSGACGCRTNSVN